MFNWFKRHPSTSEAGKLGNVVKRDRQRQSYKRFHDDMAAKLGRTIKWAD